MRLFYWGLAGEITPPGTNLSQTMSPPSGTTLWSVVGTGGYILSPSSKQARRYFCSANLLSVMSSAVLNACRISSVSFFKIFSSLSRKYVVPLSNDAVYSLVSTFPRHDTSCRLAVSLPAMMKIAAPDLISSSVMPFSVSFCLSI